MSEASPWRARRRRPSAAAALPGSGGTVPDIVEPGLRVLFCGINPGRMSGARGQHFARPGNRFWKVLHLAGFTERLLAPSEQWSLLYRGIGITNLVAETTRAATDLTVEQLRQGALQLEVKVAEWRPAFVAVLGMQAYRVAFRRPAAMAGEQSDLLSQARLWVLPILAVSRPATASRRWSPCLPHSAGRPV